MDTIKVLNRNRKLVILVTTIAIGIVVASLVASTFQYSPELAPQQTDPNFDATVKLPAYTNVHPVVFVDQAHNNFHTINGSYKPFADLLTNDGYTVLPNNNKFTQTSLQNCSVMVIVNALGESGGSAFSQDECNAVVQWVNSGGSLLLIADHNPFGGASQKLANEFGVNMSEGGTLNEAHADLQNGGNTGWLIYSRENGLLDSDSITNGRNVNETVNIVETFAGQSLKGPQASIPFLKLADTAIDILPSGKSVSDVGCAQGISLQFGQGRVVVLGEAGMLTAQLTRGGTVKAGMNREGNDNKQLTLNIMHWLSELPN